MIQQNHLAETVASLQDGSLAIEEYLKELQLRTEDVEPKIKSLLPESDRWSRLRSNAKQIADTNKSHRNQKPLYGVPVGIKDIIRTSGFQTKANSSLPPEELTGPEAVVVRQLKAAGAVIFAKTVTTEFAYWEPGPTRNPYDTNHTPGGPSSGSAAAVAAGLCPLALGTQTIGSIIRPASFCGIVGVKPSYDRVSAKGVIPLSKSVDHVGFFTQDVPGAEIAASVLYEEWQTVPEKVINLPTVGIPEGPYLRQANPDAIGRFRSHCDKLNQNGYEVKEVPVLSHIETVNQNHERLIAAEAAMAHHEWYQEYGDKYAAQTAKLIQEEYDVPTKEIAVGRHSRSKTRDHIINIMDANGIDIWIAPGACDPAPEDIDSTGDPIMNLPWTHAGLPVLGLPTDDHINGLPLGVQCIGRFNTDEYLLKCGRNIAQTLQS